MIKEMTPAEFVARAADEPAPLLLDVREEWELAIAAVEGATHMPMDEEQPERPPELWVVDIEDKNHDRYLLYVNQCIAYCELSSKG